MLDKLKIKASKLKEESKKLIQKAKDLESNIRELLISIPNTPHNEVPSGDMSTQPNTQYSKELKSRLLAIPLYQNQY